MPSAPSFVWLVAVAVAIFRAGALELHPSETFGSGLQKNLQTPHFGKKIEK